MARGSVAGPPVGWSPGVDAAWVYNRTGGSTVLGNVLTLDLGQTATESTNNDVGSVNSGLANGITPVTANVGFGIYGIVIGGNLVDNGLVKVQISGIVEAGVDAASAINNELSVLNAQVTLDAGAVVAGSKIIGIQLDATAGAGVARVMFDGMSGFGMG